MRDEKLHVVVARSTFASKSAQNTPTSEHCWKMTCSKSARRCAAKSKMWGFCSSFKSLGRRGTFEEDLQTCISRGRRNTRDMFIRDVRRSGR